MKKIHYLVHLDVENNCFKKRKTSPAAQTKATYILEVLNRIGYSVNVISLLFPINIEADRGGTTKIGENSITFFRFFGKDNIFKRIFSFLSRKIGLIVYFLINIHKNDTVIAYHCLDFLRILFFLKRIIKFKLILEVEEVYADVIGDKKCRIREFKLFQLADSYIFPTELLNKKINVNNRPYCIIHGTYRVEKEYKKLWKDDKIHIVYAGTLDPRKGAMAAVESAKYLSEDYHLHILGFGNEIEKGLLLNEINRVSKITNCLVTYDGCLSGEEYINFLQSCDIGLSTQNPNASFNDTSFPSKILSYMSNGLRVVTVKIPAIEQSLVNNQMYYYNEQSPKEIANIISQINFDDGYDSRKKITELDLMFTMDIKKLLGE